MRHRSGVKVADEVNGHRHVVRGRRRVVLVEEPDALLRVRQRNDVRSRFGFEFQSGATAEAVQFGPLGESTWGGILKKVSDGDLGVQCRIDAGHRTGRNE
ncbi:hypothetical protein GCM10011410_13340 [Hoyosella rhizosphaerae]|uniref:Uncharacterized protein n=1 Tax=Hoyosella rhizosphaerae TaxID=1755582 RepID=A0A916U717_9ACTN|nr:hypothetical protein GCM10011410_13340 [Hoyosella rhizosphaerae]